MKRKSLPLYVFYDIHKNVIELLGKIAPSIAGSHGRKLRNLVNRNSRHTNIKDTPKHSDTSIGKSLVLSFFFSCFCFMNLDIGGGLLLLAPWIMVLSSPQMCLEESEG